MGVRYAAREQVDAGIFLLLEFIHVLGRNDTILHSFLQAVFDILYIGGVARFFSVPR